jgi:hypothetical protein
MMRSIGPPVFLPVTSPLRTDVLRHERLAFAKREQNQAYVQSRQAVATKRPQSCTGTLRRPARVDALSDSKNASEKWQR